MLVFSLSYVVFIGVSTFVLYSLGGNVYHVLTTVCAILIVMVYNVGMVSVIRDLAKKVKKLEHDVAMLNLKSCYAENDIRIAEEIMKNLNNSQE